MCSLAIQRQRRLQIGHVRDQVDRLCIRFLPTAKRLTGPYCAAVSLAGRTPSFSPCLGAIAPPVNCCPSTVISRLGAVRQTYCHCRWRSAA